MASPAEPPTGAQLALERGEQRAVVTEVGAGLRSLRVGGAELLDGFGADEPAPDFRGKLLAPWPNRLRDGRYAFAGEEHRVPVTEPERGVALHGLVLWSAWRVRDRGADHVTLATVLHPRPGYPFTVGLEAAYALDGTGLAVRLRAVNLGGGPAPFGAGFHPYLRAGATPVDAARLQVPARARIPVDDERKLPSGPPVPVAGTDDDFSAPRPIGPRAIDTCFTELERDADGRARVRLTGPDRELTVWMDEAFAYAQVYTADAVADPARRRASVAIEPMTCAPDALNSGAGLIVLAPGESVTGCWGIDAA